MKALNALKSWMPSITGAALLVVGLAVTGSTAVVADTQTGGQALVAKLKALRPDIPIERVTPSPLPGIYQLELAGGTVFYGTEDGRYLFAGDLYELGDDDLVNLAEQGRVEKRQTLLASVDVDDMIVFAPSGERKSVISVFTDVDCGYCQKLHQEVPQLNEMGVEVRYLAYPRAGVGSRSYQKIVSVPTIYRVCICATEYDVTA